MAVSLRQQARAIEDSKETATQPAQVHARNDAVKARQLLRKSERVKRIPWLPKGSTKTSHPGPRAKRKGVSKKPL